MPSTWLLYLGVKFIAMSAKAGSVENPKVNHFCANLFNLGPTFQILFVKLNFLYNLIIYLPWSNSILSLLLTLLYYNSVGLKKFRRYRERFYYHFHIDIFLIRIITYNDINDIKFLRMYAAYVCLSLIFKSRNRARRRFWYKFLFVINILNIPRGGGNFLNFRIINHYYKLGTDSLNFQFRIKNYSLQKLN